MTFPYATQSKVLANIKDLHELIRNATSKGEKKVYEQALALEVAAFERVSNEPYRESMFLSSPPSPSACPEPAPAYPEKESFDEKPQQSDISTDDDDDDDDSANDNDGLRDYSPNRFLCNMCI